MNVRDLQISLRPRKGWEAVDLGFALTKAHYQDLLKVGLKGFLPFFLLIFLLCWKIPYIGLFIIWWAKPIYDRFYLHYLSRRIFGNEITVKEVLKAAPQHVFKRVFLLMTFRRFSPWRSMTLPVHDLEQLSRKDYNRRCRAVTRIGGSEAVTVTSVLSLCESLVCISVFILLVLLIPEAGFGITENNIETLLNGKEFQNILMRLSAFIFAIVYLFLEPFYIGVGFSLYLNSRCSQEAWDIELRFKEFASRVKNSTLKGVSSVNSVLLFSMTLIIGLSSVTTVEAKKADVGISQQLSPQSVIEKVYNHEDFKIHTGIKKEWKFDKNVEEALEKFFESIFNKMGSGSGVSGNIIESVLKGLAIIILSALGIALIVVLVKQFTNRQGREIALQNTLKKEKPKTVLGMEVTEASLPENLLASAQEAWRKGEYKTALSYLYRGALSKTIIDYDAEIESSDTEYECTKAAQKVLPSPAILYFRSLSNHWITVAYSKDSISESDFNTLCQKWPFNEQ